MNAILGFSQIMKMDPENNLSETYQENVRHILKAGQHLKVLIDEVLDLSKIESGNIEFSPECFPVGPAIREILVQMEPLRKSHDIRIITENLTDSEHIICVDSMRFKQILINLVSNGLKYNHRGGTLTLSVTDRPGNIVAIRVQDTGVGIPEDKIDQLFEPFNRLNFEYGGIEGTGIGLNIARELVQLMKGTIEVESTVGEGSCFTVAFPSGRLPETQASSSPAGASSPRTQHVSKDGDESGGGEMDAIDPSEGNTLEIFYIEDHPTNTHLVESIVSLQPHFRLRCAETAERGLELIRKKLPDVILMDIRLPGMDGFEAFRHLRANPETRSIPVVAITAHAMANDIRKAKELGFDAYLTKPLDVDLFFETLDRMVPPG